MNGRKAGAALEGTTIEGYRTKQDLVYLTIKDSIVSGTLKPGERLVIRDLAAKLRVSETPVRVALTRLASEGLADHISHIGAVVAQARYEDLKDVHAIMSALQGLAAERAAELITPESAARLRSILSKLANLPDTAPLAEFVALNYQFHRAVSDVAGYTLMAGLTDHLFDKLERGRLLWSAPAHREKARDEHQAILTAIENKLPGEARNRMENHWLRSGRDFASQLSDQFWASTDADNPVA